MPKPPAQLDAEIAEALATSSVSNERRTDVPPHLLPPHLLPGYSEALARARSLLLGGVGWATASVRAVLETYRSSLRGAGANDEAFGGDVRRVYKAIGDELRPEY